VVAAFLAFKGFLLIYENTPHFIHAFENRIALTYQDYLLVTPWVVDPVCAWGLLAWRRWARIAAIALSSMEIAAIVALAAMYGWLLLDRNILLWTAANCAVVIWLALPQVRAGYSQQQRQQTA
jgi:hypothetical protein